MRKALFFLGILDDADIDWLLSAGQRRHIPSGAMLIRQGEPIPAVYVVIDGELRVTVDPDREVARLRSGDIVGEMSFVDERPPSANVTSVSDAVVLAVPRGPLGARLQGDPAFAARFYRALAVFLADRLRTTTGQTADDDAGELDPAVLDRVTLAGARFDWLIRRLREK